MHVFVFGRIVAQGLDTCIIKTGFDLSDLQLSLSAAKFPSQMHEKKTSPCCLSACGQPRFNGGI